MSNDAGAVKGPTDGIGAACRRPPCGLLLAVLILVGCDGNDSPGVTERDSAGVRVTVTEPGPLEYARLDSTPMLSLGGADATGPRQFRSVQGVYLDPEGRIWVADGASGEVRIFEADGSHVRTTGGSGGGPGEFRRLRFLGAFHGDSVALWDAAAPRLTTLDSAGELARTARPPPTDEPTPLAHDIFADGALLAQLPRIIPAAALERGQVLADTAKLIRWELAGDRRQRIAALPGPAWLWTGRRQVALPFTTNPGFDVQGGAVYIVAGPELRVRVYRDGQLADVFGVDVSPRSVTDHDIEAYRRSIEELMPASPTRDAYLSALEHPAAPELLPGYDRVLVSMAGNVWAGLYSPDPLAATTWHVYGPEGEWLGRVPVPPGFTPYTFREGRVAGVWRDGLGVEHVRVYRLR